MRGVDAVDPVRAIGAVDPVDPIGAIRAVDAVRAVGPRRAGDVPVNDYFTVCTGSRGDLAKGTGILIPARMYGVGRGVRHVSVRGYERRNPEEGERCDDRRHLIQNSLAHVPTRWSALTGAKTPGIATRIHEQPGSFFRATR